MHDHGTPDDAQIKFIAKSPSMDLKGHPTPYIQFSCQKLQQLNKHAQFHTFLIQSHLINFKLNNP